MKFTVFILAVSSLLASATPLVQGLRHDHQQRDPNSEQITVEEAMGSFSRFTASLSQILEDVRGTKHNNTGQNDKCCLQAAPNDVQGWKTDPHNGNVTQTTAIYYALTSQEGRCGTMDLAHSDTQMLMTKLPWFWRNHRMPQSQRKQLAFSVDLDQPPYDKVLTVGIANVTNGDIQPQYHVQRVVEVAFQMTSRLTGLPLLSHR